MPRRKLTEKEKAERKAKMELKKRVRNNKFQLESALKECLKTANRSGSDGDPTYFYNIGDRVTWGNWQYVVVLEIFEDGKFYKVLKITDQIDYGKYVGQKFEITYAFWTEIRPYRTIEEKKAPSRLVEDDDIRFGYAQRDIRSILYMVYGGSGIDLEPEYQRDFVWTPEQKVELIESIFRNIEIGKFAIIRRKFREELKHYYEVLDGKQRIKAICEFYENKFPVHGKYYNDLHWRDRYHFTGYSISWAETEPLTDEQKYRYFLKLNVGGVPVSKEHMQKVHKMWKEEKEKE